MNSAFDYGFLVQEIITYEFLPGIDFFFPCSIHKFHFLILHFFISENLCDIFTGFKFKRLFVQAQRLFGLKPWNIKKA